MLDGNNYRVSEQYLRTKAPGVLVSAIFPQTVPHLFFYGSVHFSLRGKNSFIRVFFPKSAMLKRHTQMEQMEGVFN